MAKSNFEPYAYLYDNGFFDPIEVIVDDNEIRVPETIVPENIYYTPPKSASKSKPDKYESFLKSYTKYGGIVILDQNLS